MIQPDKAEQSDVRLTPQPRLAPEAHQFGSALAYNVSHYHAIDSSRRRRGGSIQVGIAVNPQQIDVLVIAPRAGEQTDYFRAIATQHQHQGATFHRDFRARLQVVQSGDYFLQIAGAAMLFVISKATRRAVAMIDDFKTSTLQFFNESRGA